MHSLLCIKANMLIFKVQPHTIIKHIKHKTTTTIHHSKQANKQIIIIYIKSMKSLALALEKSSFFLFNFILNHYILIFLLARTVFAVCYFTVFFFIYFYFINMFRSAFIHLIFACAPRALCMRI